MSLLPWEVAPERYEALLHEKTKHTASLFTRFAMPEPSCFPSPPTGYRARAEFRVWHEGSDLYYVMFNPAESRVPVRVESFPAALPPIQEVMPRLLAELRDNEALRHKLFQVEFMGTRAGEVLVTLAYHRKLDENWESTAQSLAGEFDVSIVGRSRKQKLVIGRDYINEVFHVAGEEFRYRQYEQAFAQPNAPVNQHMLNWAVEQLGDQDSDLLELYCGNGNFTLPMARYARNVIATELSKSGTRAALENLTDNAIDNVHVIRLSAEEVSQAMAGEREFRRLAVLPQPLADYDLRTVFVDPPRAGLDPATLQCVQQFEHILYISCNPETLAQNLDALIATHRPTAFALFDQFPYTHHMECGVMLQRR